MSSDIVEDLKIKQYTFKRPTGQRGHQVKSFEWSKIKI